MQMAVEEPDKIHLKVINSKDRNILNPLFVITEQLLVIHVLNKKDNF